ncbi:diguanylate cyclase (GGDEF)-like protein [Actinoplanes lutulentus]|nr:bifunctional diguanylate cyclase/phosphodiesterase [Actinoplanes lutulentus]MBB2946646.1 diguanylate cyclase (GGDEF)-like protein [Actinoplanes lutulentus]
MTRSNGRRSVVMTASLALVLLALGGYVIQGIVHTTRATDQQREALVVDMLFTEARIAVAMQEVNLRHYQVEPSVAVQQRFAQIADTTSEVLSSVAAKDDARTRADAERLLRAQARYRELAEQLITMVADSDPGFAQLDRLEVTPAFYSLQNDVDEVSRASHEYAQEQVSALRRTQVQLLVGTLIGFGLGLAMVAMIMRLIVGHQRRLVDQAVESQHRAMHDPLTGLPNRELFYRELTHALAGKNSVAILVIDLDGFKAVNDTLGHQAGDLLLIEAGRRLTGGVGGRGVVARLGGDEFAVLLTRANGLTAVRALAEQLVAGLRRDFVLDGLTAAISGSLGIALGEPGDAGDELFRHADAAMYRAKNSGGGVAVYQPSIDTGEPDRMSLFADLRGLLDAGDPDGQLRLHYQPQVRLSDAEVVAVEALVRWEHPDRGLLMPAAFLPSAERGGLEIPLTHHLIAVAVRQASSWMAAGRRWRVSVNVSPGALNDDAFADRVLAAIAAAGLPAELLRLELTETSIMTDPGRAVQALREVSAHGVSVSVDDFGTGFSSLVQLRDVPADELKIDRTFVRDLRDGTPDAVMVRSSIDLGHNLGLEVVAEGVEDVETLARLREMSCDFAQGYALSRPVPAADLPAACEQARAVAAEVIPDRPLLPNFQG